MSHWFIISWLQLWLWKCSTVYGIIFNILASQCCVCEQELPSSSAHKCLKCRHAVHAICGKNPDGDEGYGCPVECNICLKSAVSEEKKRSREFLHQSTFSQIFSLLPCKQVSFVFFLIECYSQNEVADEKKKITTGKTFLLSNL